MNKNSQLELIKEFFSQNPYKNILHAEAVDWLVIEWKKRTGKVFRDPDRGIRSLAQQGFLIKVSKGIYRHEPNSIINRHLEDFSELQKKIIKERDNYKCVICGKGLHDGVELHVDHIKPKELDGKLFWKTVKLFVLNTIFKRSITNRLKLVKKCLFVSMSKQNRSMI